ncbi:hypothetical protein EDC14_10425 [Hydrogenispora ethanolica]|uniref:Energy-coupling factor transport system substrate-specific component n=1 Tax=Hydrogenispora ethanolica TaxID=1082276 RepID=A0A4R1QZ94_HYDET|nr:hypothetical protein [Hydrogenispora ethanolica]TCL58312.1 hypothetical protein EDC14_10425 [Hydrogenispora ethanolica]
MKMDGVTPLALILTGLAVILQWLPGLLGAEFALVTVLSALPIFILTRARPLLGPFGYWAAGLLLFAVNPQQSAFFILVNGPLGVLLGLGPLYSGNDRLVALITGLVVTFNMAIIMFGMNVHYFGIWLPGPFPVQLAVLTLASFLFCYAYLSLGNLVLRHPLLRQCAGLPPGCRMSPRPVSQTVRFRSR